MITLKYETEDKKVNITLDPDIDIFKLYQEFERFAIVVGYHPESIKEVFKD